MCNCGRCPCDGAFHSIAAAAIEKPPPPLGRPELGGISNSGRAGRSTFAVSAATPSFVASSSVRAAQLVLRVRCSECSFGCRRAADTQRSCLRSRLISLVERNAHAQQLRFGPMKTYGNACSVQLVQNKGCLSKSMTTKLAT